jgi:gas vesicle protein
MNDRIYYSRDAEMQAQRERAAAVVIFLAMGLGIGAVLALLFAPKRGEDIRKELGHSLNESLEGGREATNKAIHRLEKDFETLRKRVEDRIGQ